MNTQETHYKEEVKRLTEEIKKNKIILKNEKNISLVEGYIKYIEIQQQLLDNYKKLISINSAPRFPNETWRTKDANGKECFTKMSEEILLLFILGKGSIIQTFVKTEYPHLFGNLNSHQMDEKIGCLISFAASPKFSKKNGKVTPIYEWEYEAFLKLKKFAIYLK